VVRQLPVTKTHTFAAYVDDDINIGEHWNIVAALRFDHFGARFDQPLGTPSSFSHLDNVFSPRAAITYKPDERSSIYFSYGTSFNPSAEDLALSASNQALPPEKDHTYEVGGKIQVLNDMLSLSAAAFDTTMENARITDPLFPSLQALAGTEKVRGIEVGAQGRITEHWEVIAGYTFLDPTAVGLVAKGVRGPIPNTSKHQGNLWTTYDFDNSLKVGAGINVIGTRFAGTDTLVDPGHVIVAKAPGFVTFDAMAGYSLTETLSLQVNVYNLFDQRYLANSYFTRPNENHTVPGAGRTAMFTANVSL
jgi:catecholate siderophore receptor